VFEIMTHRLRLRPLTLGDLDALAGVYTHPLVARWIGHHTREVVEGEIRRHMSYQAERGYSFWAVEDRASGRFLGDCGLEPLEHRGPEIELGYDLHPDAWGRGIGTEAARAAVDAAFGPLGMERLIAVVRPEHVASQRVLEKTGFTRDGERIAYGIPMLLYRAERRVGSPP
jgi:ribosomal-protein-alanine N-acetyltransferase